MASEPQTLCDCVRLNAARQPQAAAFHCGETTLSWLELEQSTAGLARWFLDQGLRPGDRVAVYSPNSIALVQVYLGLFRAGLIAVTINIRLKPEEVAYMFQHAEPRMAFCDPSLAPMLEQAGVTCPVFSRLPDPPPSGADLGPEPAVAADQPAVIIYTSGTTAKPKGVTHSHRSLFSKGANSAWMGGEAPDHVGVCAVPMMHVSGLWSLAVGLHRGIPLVILPKFDPAAWLDAIERFSATITGGLPVMVQMMVEEQSRQPRDTSSLRFVIAAGDAVSTALQDRFQALFGVELLEGYGMTELCFMAANRTGRARPGSVGLPLEGVDIRIVDDDDREVTAGETGEIVVRGSSAFVGYWNDAGATRIAMANGWLHTGDLGRRDADGYVWFGGRKKEIIIRAGSNISPQEVEEALYRHPAVLEVGVIGVPCPVNTERVAAFVVLRDGHTAAADELCHFARLHIADYKAPEEIHFLEVLPKNAVGKVQRRALKERIGLQ